MLSINNLKKYYHTKKDEILALDNISFEINNNELISIVGPSGCGKSTILSIIAGVLSKSNGEINKNCSIGYMLQNDLLFDWLTILDNCLLGLSINGKVNNYDKEYVINLLKKYGLYEYINKYPSSLSGGMKQRAALIRTLAIRPDILLLDEPFSAIDASTRVDVANDIYNILTKEDKGFILVTHDIKEAVSMSDKILILSNRPSYIKEMYISDIGGNPKERRNNKLFNNVCDYITREIDSNVQ